MARILTQDRLRGRKNYSLNYSLVAETHRLVRLLHCSVFKDRKPLPRELTETVAQPPWILPGGRGSTAIIAWAIGTVNKGNRASATMVAPEPQWRGALRLLALAFTPSGAVAGPARDRLRLEVEQQVVPAPRLAICS
jgi:hypothetical protein